MRPSSNKSPPTSASSTVAPHLLLNEVRAAEFLSVNPRTLQQWRLRGGGPQFVKISTRCVRYRYADLIGWMEARLRSSTSEGC